MLGTDERHDQRVLPLNQRLGTGQAGSVHPDKIAVLLLRPQGEHLATALLVELRAPIPALPGDAGAETKIRCGNMLIIL